MKHSYPKALILCAFIFVAFSKNYCQAIASKFVVDRTIACLNGNVFHFVNQSVGDSLTFTWQFDDGTTSIETNPVKSFVNAGFYNVTLIAVKQNISYYYSKQITVAPEPNVSNIDIQKTFIGRSYTYISNSTIASGSMTYFWNFSDSICSSLINPTHTYKDTGTYNTQLTVISDNGCSAQKSKLISILINDSTTLIPTFSINKSTQCFENNNFTFSYTGDTTDVTSINWDFGDGTTSSSKTVTKHYNNPGKYIVKISVNKNGSLYDNERIIFANTIEAGFITLLQSDKSTYTFFASDNSFINSKTFTWNFGDGCTLNSFSGNHNYYPGTYNATLKITDQNGCNDSTTQSVTILQQPVTPVVAAFTTNDTLQSLLYNKFIFKNNSTKGCNIKYLWSFGDGTTSTLDEPTKIYTDTGTYKIILKVFAGNLITSFEKKIVVTNSNTWLGNTSNDWFNATNWQYGVPDKNTNIVIVSTSKNMPLINNTTVDLNNINIETGAYLSIKNCTVNIYGSIVNKGICNAETSKLIFCGSILQSITGSLDVAKLVIKNSTSITINDTVKILKLLTLNNGNLITNNKLILKSTATQTAQLDKVNTAGNIGTITGNVVVERYFQNKRAWRFYTTPFTANGNNTDYTVNKTIQTFTNVTGPTGTGFDFLSQSYSLKAWSDGNNAWEDIKNTLTTYTSNNNSDFSNIPYFVFVRGNKKIAEIGSSEVTFKVSGKLQMGDQVKNFSGRTKGNYLFVGNPYAATIDLAAVQAQSKGLSGNFYLWDPSLNTNGAYVTISNKGNGVWITTPAAAQKDRYMQSGQAMLFQVADSTGFVKFTEDAKVDTNYVDVFGSANKKMDRLTVNLYKVNADNSKTLIDGAITLFNENYSKDVDENDTKKILNPQENIGFINNDSILAIEARPYVAGEDSLHIYTSGLNDSSKYAIEVITDYFDTTVQQIALIDSSLKKSNDAFFNTSTWYYFDKQNGNVNYNNNRFSIVLRSTKLISGKVENFVVIKENKNAKLSWNVITEQGVKEFQIQYSRDNVNFTTIAMQAPFNNNNTNDYTFLNELNGKTGKHYYRIKTIYTNDIEQVSKTEMVEFIAPMVINKNVFVYPNPTKNIFNLHFYSEIKQSFNIQVVEVATGNVITTKYIQASIGENITTINLAEFKNISNGMYVVKAIGEEINLEPQRLFFNR